MSELTKITEKLASTIANKLELSEEALQVLSETDTPASYFQQLTNKALYSDAIVYLANALPKREAVWWACVCARECLQENPSKHDIKAIELAEAWVYKPAQTTCKPTYLAATETEFKSPAGWAAISAFWSGENISPSEEAIIPPTDDLTGKAVNGALQLAAVINQEPDAIVQNYQLFLAKGIDIANGGDGRTT